ncbi:MAG: carboxypeptidase M32 [Rickettsiales bacterium]|nr:MAG: carboxypeptidase M32 [Rickettsiales bacterium]
MTASTKDYDNLETELEQITHLQNLFKIAHWDSSTMLASGSAPSRQKEIATLLSVIHEKSTSDKISDLINGSLGEFEHLNDWQRSNLANAKKTYDMQVCVTSELQHEYNIASAESEFVWREARLQNDFKKLEPYLDRVFDSVRNIASIQAKKLRRTPLDVLIDSYDPDRTSADVRSVFDVLKAELPPLIERVMAKQESEKVIPLSETISEETQKAIGLRVMGAMGFDMNLGRLDKSVHPFCIGSNDDLRITTRYDEKNFLSSLFGVIHETGHALYLQNLPAEYRSQPVGDYKGMAFHESQSLIMENQVGTSRAFMEFLAKMLKDEFSFSGPEYSAENLYKLVTRVKPSFIRVEADEATYPLHVIMRFEIEEAIINGNLKAMDLPDIWNSKMEEYLGIVPSSDREGCLQDVHWPSGMVGYFPSYTNGALIASMLMKSAKEKYPEIDSELSTGNFTSLNRYLTDNLRKYGCSKNSADLLEASTGHRSIAPGIFIDYLKGKYLQ